MKNKTNLSNETFVFGPAVKLFIVLVFVITTFREIAADNPFDTLL